MYRLGIVLGDGELGLFDHRLQSVLGQGEALGVAQAGQLGIVSGIHAQNGEFGAAAPDLGEQLVVACHEYLAAFQLADHLTEQPAPRMMLPSSDTAAGITVVMPSSRS